VDDNDPQVEAYKKISIDRLRIHVGPGVGSALALKALMKMCDSEWMKIGTDDIVYETPRWDEKMIAAMPKDRVGLVFTSDGLGNQCNHFLFHRKLFELTDMWPDVFWHFGPDGYIGKVIEGVAMERRVFLKSVMIRHLQAKSHKAGWDLTFLEERKNGPGYEDMKRAMEFFDRDVSILKAEVERCKSLTSTV
jgi:hypothetical protein